MQIAECNAPVAKNIAGVKHGCPIAGDMILGLLVGPDITGLGDRDAEQWMEKMLKDFEFLEKE